MPRAGETYRLDTGTAKLVRKHDADQTIWVITWVGGARNGTSGYVGDDQLAGLRPVTSCNPVAVDPAAGSGLEHSVIIAQQESRVHRAVAMDGTMIEARAAEPEEPVTPAPEPTPTLPPAPREVACAHCSVVYTEGKLGVPGGHNCEVVKRLKCIRCGKQPDTAPARAHKGMKKRLCSVCITAGWDRCKSCGIATKKDQLVSERCGNCKPRDRIIWKRDRKPTGDYMSIEVASLRPWSVEIEAYRLPEECVATRGRLRRCWREARDMSIHPNHDDSDESVEFKGGPFIGDKGLLTFKQDVDTIRSWGFRSNTSCGVHVHVDLSGTTADDRGAMMKYCRWIEEDIYRLVAPSRRTTSRFARPLASAEGTPRYRWANIQAYEKFGTIEFRLHHGTTRADNIVEWIKVCLRIVERGLKLGRLARRPQGDLYTLLGLTEIEKEYWDDRTHVLHNGR